jgi:hypothetical protein
MYLMPVDFLLIIEITNVPRYFKWEWVLDGQARMTGAETGGKVWTVTRAGETIACCRSAA